jgi:hypothetical protein
MKYDNENDFETVPDLSINSWVIIIEYRGYGGEVNIPASIKNCPVTCIVKDAFIGHPLTSITIPNIRKTARFT